MNSYLVLADHGWLCFIPDDEFEEYFEIVDEDEAEVIIREDKFRNCYSGGSDTYLQSHCLDHARCGIMAGGDCKFNLLGIYHLRPSKRGDSHE